MGQAKAAAGPSLSKWMVYDLSFDPLRRPKRSASRLNRWRTLLIDQGDVFNRSQTVMGTLLRTAPPLIIDAFLMNYYIAGLTAGATNR
jgi:hypothetical protein